LHRIWRLIVYPYSNACTDHEITVSDDSIDTSITCDVPPHGGSSRLGTVNAEALIKVLSSGARGETFWGEEWGSKFGVIIHPSICMEAEGNFSRKERLSA